MDDYVCPVCHGLGEEWSVSCNENAAYFKEVSVCRECSGTGVTDKPYPTSGMIFQGDHKKALRAALKAFAGALRKAS